MSLFLAVDAGGTKTDYLLAEESRELARVRGGCIKRMRVDAPTAEANLTAALNELEESSGRALVEVEHTCIGTAGDTVPLVTEWLRSAFPPRVGGGLDLLGDVEIALEAAFFGGPGVLVLAGTGSNVAGRCADGTLIHAGGWGPLMADQGSANRIGLNALRAGFLAVDEQRSTVLLEEAIRFWGLGSQAALIAFSNSVPAPDFSRLAATVQRCAVGGDGVAQEVLRREGQELGYLVRLVTRRVLQASTAAEARREAPELAFAGSVAEHVELLRQEVIAETRREFPSVTVRDGAVDPLQGALVRARRTAAGSKS